MNFLENINILLAKLHKKDKDFYVQTRREAAKEELYKKIQVEYDTFFGKRKTRFYLKLENLKMNDVIGLDKDMIDVMNRINTIFYNYIKNFKIISAEDFIDNLATGESGRKIKIGKLLEKIKTSKDLYDDEAEVNYLIKKFNQRPSKNVLKVIKNVQLYAVISRSAEDVAGMSSDRRWTSCMRLPGYKNTSKYEYKDDGGDYYSVLESDIKYGTLVAYLIREDDRNIEDPIARISIKPYFNIVKDDTNVSNMYLLPEKKIYSDSTLTQSILLAFHNKVNEFFENVNKNKVGYFEIPVELYPDTNPTRISKVDESIYKEMEKNGFNVQLLKSCFNDRIDEYAFQKYAKIVYSMFKKDKNHHLIKSIKNGCFYRITKINESNLFCDKIVGEFGDQNFNFFANTVKDAVFNGGYLATSYLINSTIKSGSLVEIYQDSRSSIFEHDTTLIPSDSSAVLTNWIYTDNKWYGGKLYSKKFEKFITTKNSTIPNSFSLPDFYTKQLHAYTFEYLVESLGDSINNE